MKKGLTISILDKAAIVKLIVVLMAVSVRIVTIVVAGLPRENGDNYA